MSRRSARASRSTDLSFVDTFFSASVANTHLRYRSATWLKSTFDCEVWACHFVMGSFEIDWRVQVGEAGGMLTSNANRDLLTTLRCWLVLTTHFDATSNRLLAPKSAYGRVRDTLACIDYLLLNADRLGITKCGLTAITRTDLLEALVEICASGSLDHGVYQWPVRATCYLRERILEVSDAELGRMLRDFPFLAIDLPPNELWLTGLTSLEVVKARAWCWREGLYYEGYGRSAFKWRLATERLAARVLCNTLIGRCKRGHAHELGLLPREKDAHEFPAAPVMCTAPQISELRLRSYRERFSDLGLLDAVNLPVPRRAIASLTDAAVRQAISAKPSSRYRTLPPDVVFDALRNAIQFSLSYGDALVDSYLSLAGAAKSENRSVFAYAYRNGVVRHLSPRIKKLGVSRWSVDGSTASVSRPLERGPYYDALRRNEGLWELIVILLASVQIIIGTLMARRVDELCELVSGKCFDASGANLSLSNRKSGFAGNRERITRPIPTIAIKAIGQIERLQDGLVDLHILPTRIRLFSRVPREGTRMTNAEPWNFNDTINYFCDYFETRCDTDGRRFYIRQHQLRRFFAMLYFWSDSFGGLDTLREFLGHNDSRSVYRYITESIPGSVLSNIKVDWAFHGVIEQWNAATELSSLLESHFGTRDFHLLSADELRGYIADLLQDGTISIEPHFIDRGKHHRVLIEVHAYPI